MDLSFSRTGTQRSSSLRILPDELSETVHEPPKRFANNTMGTRTTNSSSVVFQTYRTTRKGDVWNDEAVFTYQLQTNRLAVWWSVIVVLWDTVSNGATHQCLAVYGIFLYEPVSNHGWIGVLQFHICFCLW